MLLLNFKWSWERSAANMQAVAKQHALAHLQPPPRLVQATVEVRTGGHPNRWLFTTPGARITTPGAWRCPQTPKTLRWPW